MTAPEAAGDPAGDDHPRRVSQVLADLARNWGQERLTLGEVVDQLEERAFGLLILILALPCCIPGLWGIPVIMGVPMVLIALQMVFARRHPWMPEFARRQSFSTAGFARMVETARPWLERAEAVAQPRHGWLAGARAEPFIGALILALALTVCIPLPLTNTAPGIAIAILSIGLIERDGLFIVVGMGMAAIAWVIVLATYALVASAALWIFGVGG